MSNATPHLLLVEDEPDLLELIRFHLLRAGFHVTTAHNGQLALDLASEITFDLVVLDLMLPKVDGMTVFKEMRSNKNTKHIPVIMLTAKGQASDRISGLEAGADDYITKPFAPKELILRIKKQLNIHESSKERNVVSVGDLSYDKSKLLFKHGDTPLDLTTTEFKLLLNLCENPNRLQTRSHLLKEVWGYNDDMNSRTLDTHMKRVRMKLGEAASAIQTVRGKGYIFNLED